MKLPTGERLNLQCITKTKEYLIIYLVISTLVRNYFPLKLAHLLKNEAWKASTELNYSKAINICTKQIESGKLSKAKLAEAYTIRGNVHRKIKVFNSALKDISIALEIKTDYALAYAI
ncbi:hypothetical protein [Dethiosulfatarculus sandiegensis]|uniref:hypothetical protein n=1 Tax=Dethiosulfatarculus sandiegensis TaxID=1429043 RepID=UPI0012E14680|nr:hypothetical protein [Dethiosulfatarculus sandiegensis]